MHADKTRVTLFGGLRTRRLNPDFVGPAVPLLHEGARHDGHDEDFLKENPTTKIKLKSSRKGSEKDTRGRLRRAWKLTRMARIKG